MARSSGGGSRSGGSRGGGSSRSGGGSRSGGFHSGGSRGGGSHRGGFRKTSRRPRSGCSKYIYYDRRKRAHFVYCDYDPSKPTSKLRYVLLIAYLPFLIGVLSMIASAFYIPTPVSKQMNPFDNIVIMDNIDVIADEAALSQSLLEFYEETGVTPAVVTVSHKDWQEQGTEKLEEYAFRTYYDLFSDECHWLIVYSEPEAGFKDWLWEGVIGDDTMGIIHDDTMAYLTDTLHKNFYRDISDEESVLDTAIMDAFKDTADYIHVIVNTPILGMALFMFAFIAFHASMMTGIVGGARHFKGARPVAESVKIIKCNYCDGTYGTDSTEGCPHCGAAYNEYGMPEEK